MHGSPVLFTKLQANLPSHQQLWLFTPDLHFSSSSTTTSTTTSPTSPPTTSPTSPPTPRHDPTRAAKIFWQPIPSLSSSTSFSVEALLRDQSATHEELVFPAEVLRGLRRALESSALLMPEMARTFQQWRVGLLVRFAGDVGDGL